MQRLDGKLRVVKTKLSMFTTVMKHTCYRNYFNIRNFLLRKSYFSTRLIDEMRKKAGTKTFLSQSDLVMNKMQNQSQDCIPAGCVPPAR